VNGKVVSIDINMFWQIINFFILVFVFNKYFKKPLGKMLDSRKKKITSDLSQAEDTKKAAIELQKESEEILRKAKIEANEILKTAEKKADERREAILDEAKTQREKIIKTAEMEAIKMKSDAKEMLQEEVKVLAVKLAETLIKEKINSKIESTLIDEFIDEVGEEK
jgi:F-type H+-transporting ATPase subunit b